MTLPVTQRSTAPPSLPPVVRPAVRGTISVAPANPGPMEATTITLAAGTRRHADGGTRLRERLSRAEAVLATEQGEFRQVIGDAPTLTAQRGRDAMQQDARGGVDIANRRAEALESALRTVNASLTTGAGYSQDARTEVTAILQRHFASYQVEALTQLLDVRVAAMEAAQAQTMVDALDGRVAPDQLRETLLSRLQTEAQRSNDQVLAVLAPMGVFQAGAGRFLSALDAGLQDALNDLAGDTQSQLAAAGVPVTMPLMVEDPGDRMLVTASGSYTFLRQQEQASYQVEAPGTLTLALLDWQEQGIIQPGEMALVIDRVTNGMRRTSPNPEDPVTSALERWAFHNQAVVLTPSLIARLAEGIRRPEGLSISAVPVTTANLPQFLRTLRGIAPLLRAVGIDNPLAIAPVTVSTSRSDRRAESTGISGSLIYEALPDQTGPVRPGATFGITYRWGGQASTAREVVISNGMIEENPLPQQPQRSFAITGTIIAGPDGRPGAMIGGSLSL